MIYLGEFENRHRMDVESFELLLSRVAPMLVVDQNQSRVRRGSAPVPPADLLQMTLFWLAGSRASDCWDAVGCSCPFFYAAAYRVMDAICQHPDMLISFPSTMDEIKATANDFASLSLSGVLGTCCGAVDGWLLKTFAPPVSRVSNPAGYFSGRYKCSGLNVQFCVNASSQITSVSVHCPGGTNDAVAYQRWALKDVIDSLPPGYYVAGDAAYPIGPHMAIPFTRHQLTTDGRKNYSYCISQCRIRAEMALGLLVNKWRMFHHRSLLSLAQLMLVVHACMRLHNFVIERRTLRDGRRQTRSWVDQSASSEALPLNFREGLDVDNLISETDAGNRFRDHLVRVVEWSGVQRPQP
eukprot:GHVU01024411.1.p1 GENE.GHVU01024411.1~~GHVU01024411.1.p1  ORF type:complete len:353 (-),score=17.86 GHVU01024411.1:500-1558(-)